MNYLQEVDACRSFLGFKIPPKYSDTLSLIDIYKSHTFLSSKCIFVALLLLVPYGQPSSLRRLNFKKVSMFITAITCYTCIIIIIVIILIICTIE